MNTYLDEKFQISGRLWMANTVMGLALQVHKAKNLLENGVNFKVRGLLS